MDLNRLKALREISRSGTMAAAADALCITPSAVSQQIAQLEAEVDVALTDRHGRGVRLTPAGEALVVHVERVMVILDQARSELAELKREIAGELRVAAFPSVASAIMPGVVNSLRTVFPRLHVTLEELEPLEGLAALSSWRADVAFVDDLSVPLAKKEESYGTVALMEDTLHVLLPEQHALARKASLAVADLRNENWALDSTSAAFGEFIADLCRRAGFEPRLNARCKGFELVAAMVSSGASVSIAPSLRVAKPLPGLKAVRLRPEVRRKISLAFRKGERKHPAIQVFVEEAVRAAGKQDSTKK